MDKDLQNKKIQLIQWLSTLEDESVIEKIIKLRETENAQWWKEISEKEKESIEQGVKDADSGNVKPHSAARRLYEKWL